MNAKFSYSTSAYFYSRFLCLDEVHINRDDEIEDPEPYTDVELSGMEENKNVILHLLSQLKLGMDLTKV